MYKTLAYVFFVITGLLWAVGGFASIGEGAVASAANYTQPFSFSLSAAGYDAHPGFALDKAFSEVEDLFEELAEEDVESELSAGGCGAQHDTSDSPVFSRSHGIVKLAHLPVKRRLFLTYCSLKLDYFSGAYLA